MVLRVLLVCWIVAALALVWFVTTYVLPNLSLIR